MKFAIPILLLCLGHSLAFGSEQPNSYDRILVAMPINLYPPVAEDIHSLQILTQTGDGLLKFENHRVVPNLAESWEISPDLKTYKFRLKKGLKFSDGSPITTDDVRTSIEHIFASNSILYSDLSVIEGTKEFRSKKAKSISGFRKIDDLNFELKLYAPFSPILETLASNHFAILPSDSLEKLKTKKLAPFVSSGHYVLTEVQDTKLILRKNPYHLEANSVYYDQITYTILNDRAQAVQGFNEGRFHDIWPHVIEKGESKLPLKELPSLTAFSWYIIPNMTEEPLNDLSIRRFLLARFDYDSFLRVAKLPPSYRAYGMIPKGMIGHRAHRQIPKTFGDVENLNESCVTSKPCRIEIIHAYERQEALEALVKPLREFDDRLKIKITKMPRAPWYQSLTSGKFQAVYLGNNSEYPDTYIFLRYLVKALYHPGLETDKIAKKLDQALSVADRASRSQVYQEVDDILMDQVGVIPIYHGDVPFRQVRTDIQGYEISLLGYHELKISRLRPVNP